MSRITATYLIETAEDLEKAAATMAGEQSAGTFVRVPGETDELRERFGARVEQITQLNEVDTPALTGATQSETGKYTRARVTISWNLENVVSAIFSLTFMSVLISCRVMRWQRLTRSLALSSSGGCDTGRPSRGAYFWVLAELIITIIEPVRD